MPDGIKPLPEPMLTNRQCSYVAFTFNKNTSWCDFNYLMLFLNNQHFTLHSYFYHTRPVSGDPCSIQCCSFRHAWPAWQMIMLLEASFCHHQYLFPPLSCFQEAVSGSETLPTMYADLFSHLLTFVEYSVRPPKFGKVDAKSVAIVSKAGQVWWGMVLDVYTLTHWGWDKMADIFQMTFSNAFSWYKFRLRYHWSLFPRS